MQPENKEGLKTMHTNDYEIKDTSEKFSFLVLTHVIEIEQVINTLIGLQLAKDRTKLTPYMIHFNDVGLAIKIKLAEIILKTNYPKILKNHSNIFNEIKNAQELRNQLAHRRRSYHIGSSVDSTKFVLQYKDFKKEVGFTKKQMENKLKTVENCVQHSTEVLNLVANEFGIDRIR